MYREKIEKHFKMPFDKVITDLHWDKNLSINSISKKTGVSHTAILRLCKLTKLKLRSHRDASSLNMKIKNPIHDDVAKEKRSSTIAKTFIKKELPQEKKFREILAKMNIRFEAQKSIGPYNIDFFIPGKDLCVEIDSPYKWGMDRKKAAKCRDEYLLEKGFKTIRLNKVWLNDLLNVIDILCADNSIG